MVIRAELIYGENSLVIDNFRHSAEDAETGNPYNTVFNVRVRSGDFAGMARYDCDIKSVKQFFAEIQELFDFRREIVELSDIDYGSKVTFKLYKTGQLEVSGILHGSAKVQCVTFVFKADQSVLPRFIGGFANFVHG